MRRLRHPQPQGRREPRLPRPLRAAAPRSGERRYRIRLTRSDPLRGEHRRIDRLERRRRTDHQSRHAADPRRKGDGLRRRHLQRDAPRATARRHRNRTRPLFDSRRIDALQRAAARRIDEQRSARTRAQRQPRERRRAPPPARSGRRDLQHDVGHGSHRAPHRALERARPRARLHRCALARKRRVLRRTPFARPNLRRARSARLPPARPRPAR